MDFFYYGVDRDHDELFRWIFECGELRVFEVEVWGRKARELTSVEQIRAAWKDPGAMLPTEHSVALHPVRACARVRIASDTIRYVGPEGWILRPFVSRRTKRLSGRGSAATTVRGLFERPRDREAPRR